MARKPARTTTKPAAEEKVAVKPEADIIKAPVEEAVPEKEAGKPDAATASENTEGAETAQQAADAPSQAPADDVQGQTGGEDGSDLPADDNLQQLVIRPLLTRAKRRAPLPNCWPAAAPPRSRRRSPRRQGQRRRSSRKAPTSFLSAWTSPCRRSTGSSPATAKTGAVAQAGAGPGAKPRFEAVNSRLTISLCFRAIRSSPSARPARTDRCPMRPSTS